MWRLRFALVLALAGLALPGCMATRHVECTDSAGCNLRETTYKERRWCGFWFAQPSRCEP
jgi:hypothetical protein